ncbi:unnamed protein product [Fraxinus pennsylvanica]|uniref:Inositol polyphosphate-related phosphatase domain-containing protein n=1 Tax=Fraxinus pennsylvanica TaxID=56036 RepID=A0AAD1YXZ5_9LAMI|nr:unnamed protein product [Fraxinus pennsylvanica]
MDKDNKHHGTRTIRLPSWWFSRKHKAADPFQFSVISDGGQEKNDYMDAIADGSSEKDPCISTNELRVYVGTWNVAGRSPVGSLAVDLDEWLNLKDAADIYVLGFQEIVPLKAKTVIGAEDPTEATNWNLLIGKTLNNGRPWLAPSVNPIATEDNHKEGISDFGRRPSMYRLLASKKMVGVFISVWMRRELLEKYNIAGVKVCSVACGIMGYLGNKGSVSVSMSIEGTSFCFIAAHLASGEKNGDERRRNHQVSEIFRRTYFPRLLEDGENLFPLTILGHDQIFWFGDLNYRLYLEDNTARHFIRQKDWTALQKFDQLQRELDVGGVFQGWKEGNIEFAPTYKYSSSNCNRYSGGIPSRAGEKQRTPAWCDRILWYGKGVTQLSYFRSESKFSDHRPVSALFCTRIEVEKSGNLRFTSVPTTFLPKTPIRTHGQERTADEVPSTLPSLIVTDMEVSPTYMQACISSR